MKRIGCLFLMLFFMVSAQAQSQSRFTEEEEENKVEETKPEEKPAEKPTKPAKPAKEKSDFLSRLRFGGNLGATFGSVTYINVSPRVYYAATEKLWVGVGATYIYTKYKPPYVPVETNVYGGNLFATYQVFGPIFVQAEYELISFEPVYSNGFVDERRNTNNLFLGGGFRQQVGRGAVFISVLYNVTYNNPTDNYYSQPYVIRIGFGI